MKILNELCENTLRSLAVDDEKIRSGNANFFSPDQLKLATAAGTAKGLSSYVGENGFESIEASSEFIYGILEFNVENIAKRALNLVE